MDATRILATLVALGSSTLALAGQGGQPASQQPPRFRTGIDVIQLDVTVLDAQRRPVRGTTAFDNQGKAKASRRQTARLVIVPTDAPEAQYEAILAPGPHLLTIDATADGRSTRRDVRFVRTSSR